MKNSILIFGLAIICVAGSCSSTRDTKKADPKAQQYIPERHKNQDEKSAAPGVQRDRIREKYR